MKRIPELDGIRGIAIGMVLVFHYFASVYSIPGSSLAYMQVPFRLTWSGVDLFFVLSGFLIGGILLDSRDSPDFFRTFYVRRFFRIVPIYAAVLLLTHRLMPSLGFHQVGRWWVYPLFLQNFWMAAKNDFGLWAVTWSLAVEEQFYLTLPSVIRIARRMLPYLIGAGIVLAPVLRVALFYANGEKFIAPAVLMPCRADALLLGVAAAMLMRNENASNWLRRNGRALWMAAFILLAGACAFIFHPDWIHGIQMNSIGFTWLAVLYTTLLLLAVTQPDSWVGATLRFAPLRRLGGIAYGVYLLHQVLLIALRHFIPSWRFAGIAFTSLVATFLLAILSWRYFEKPLIDYGHSL